MSRSKYRGKPVSELTQDELRKERTRCKILSEIYPAKTAKRLKKKLAAIEQRLEDNKEG